MNKYKLLGAPCFQFENANSSKDLIKKIVLEKSGGYSTAINAEKILMYSKDPKMKEVMDNSVLPVPDGSGAVLALKFLHKISSIRLDLPKVTFELAHQEAFRLFILGATEENNIKAVEQIKRKYPGINIVGRKNGFFKNEEELIKSLESTSPDIVFVALGSPKQEKFAARVNKLLPNILFIGCGGALDILAGTVSRAPKFYQDNHLEWFYRLLNDPKRIKRQKRLPIFMFKLMRESFRRKLI